MADRYDEWLCGDHWRMASRRLRRLHRRAQRRSGERDRVGVPRAPRDDAGTMMDRYREHRVRTSLGRAAAESPEPDDALRRRAAAVWSAGRGVMFFADQLDAMNPQERAAIEAAARRIYGQGGR